MMTGLQALCTEPFLIPLKRKEWTLKLLLLLLLMEYATLQHYFLGGFLFIYFSGGYNLDKCNQELELQKLIYTVLMSSLIAGCMRDKTVPFNLKMEKINSFVWFSCITFKIVACSKVSTSSDKFNFKSTMCSLGKNYTA